MRFAAIAIGACLLSGCASPTHNDTSTPEMKVDPLEEFRLRLPTMSPEELDLPKNQRNVADCVITAAAGERARLLRYLCDPDATEYLLSEADDLDSHLASHLVSELMDDAKTRIALASTCPSTRIIAALAVQDHDMRRQIIRQSKDAAVRNAYAETLPSSEVELLALLASDPDSAIASRAAKRLRK